MLSLKEIISVREVVPQNSIEGVTREKIFPHDRIKIEKTFYRVSEMEKLGDGTTRFSAVKTSRKYKPVKFENLQRWRRI